MGTQSLIRTATAEDLPALREVFRRAALSNEGDRAWIEVHPHALPFYEAAGLVEDGVGETSGGPAVRIHLDCG